ncbi:heme exporter protein CcmD [Roseococcus sp. DSY-14]
MSTHWLHVALSWGLALATFAALAWAALLRHRAARRALERLG